MALLWAWNRLVMERREAGQGLMEYGLIIMLVSIVSIAILTTLGTSVVSLFSQASAVL